MTPRALLALLLLASSARAESFDVWAARAAREERAKDDKAALRSYSRALAAWKESDGKAAESKALCARAALRDRRGDEAGALADYSGCLALDARDKKALVRRGELRLKSGRLSPAVDDFDKAIALDLDDAAAYAGRARADELRGDRAFAREDYRRACALGAKDACPKTLEPAYAAYHPRFADCLEPLRACANAGGAYGACVDRAPACERTSVKGCCPSACLKAYRKALDGGASEAAAYREIFAPGAACAH